MSKWASFQTRLFTLSGLLLSCICFLDNLIPPVRYNHFELLLISYLWHTCFYPVLNSESLADGFITDSQDVCHTRFNERLLLRILENLGLTMFRIRYYLIETLGRHYNPWALLTPNHLHKRLILVPACPWASFNADLMIIVTSPFTNCTNVSSFSFTIISLP